MDWFWHAIWICFIVIPITILWIVTVIDVVFRRHDMSGWARIGILIMVLVLPAIGALIYTGTMRRPHGPEDDYTGRGDQLTREPVQYQTFKAV
jgi:hypothetical protein